MTVIFCHFSIRSYWLIVDDIPPKLGNLLSANSVPICSRGEWQAGSESKRYGMS